MLKDFKKNQKNKKKKLKIDKIKNKIIIRYDSKFKGIIPVDNYMLEKDIYINKMMKVIKKFMMVGINMIKK